MPRLASAIACEFGSLSSEAKQRVKDASLVSLAARIEELRAFQGWMDLVHDSNPHPVVVRAQVITQNCICFVYLGEACFNVLRKDLPADSVAKKCCEFLTDNPVRSGTPSLTPTGSICQTSAGWSFGLRKVPTQRNSQAVSPSFNKICHSGRRLPDVLHTPVT